MPQLESPIFALDFKAQAAGSRKHPTMEFGRVDDRRYTGRLAKVAVDPTVGFWTAKNVSFHIKDIHSNESTDPIFGAYAPILYLEVFFKSIDTDKVFLRYWRGHHHQRSFLCAQKLLR